MSARDEVLARIRAAGVPRPPVVEAGYRRTGGLERGSAGACDLLADRLRDYRATVVRCAARDVPVLVAELLADVASVVVPDGVPAGWVRGVAARVLADEPPLSRRALDEAGAVLTTCRVAIAETGTLVLDGGPGQGRRVLSLLPDRQVVVVLAERVVHSVPEGVAVLRDVATRPLTWISGPSATSDIELVRVEGVHGPRDLRVLVVED